MKRMKKGRRGRAQGKERGQTRNFHNQQSSFGPYPSSFEPYTSFFWTLYFTLVGPTYFISQTILLSEWFSFSSCRRYSKSLMSIEERTRTRNSMVWLDLLQLGHKPVQLCFLLGVSRNNSQCSTLEKPIHKGRKLS